MRGSDLLKQGKLDQAQRAFRAALELDPDSVRVLALLGLAHFRANELAEAREVYEQLVGRTPTDASHRLNLGLVYLKLNDADRAIGALEASRALDPSQGRAVSYLGLAYARAGRYGEAYRAFLIAGQNDLAIEIESNLGPGERDRIHHQLGRTPQGLLPLADVPAVHAAPAVAAAAIPRTPTPPAAPRTLTPPRLPRTPTPTGVARTPTAPAVTRTPTPVAVARTQTPPSGVPTAGGPVTPAGGLPRTRPPAPPAKSRTPSQELPAAAPPEPSSSVAITSDRDGALRVDPGPPIASPITLPGAPPAAPPEVAAAPHRRDPSRVTDSMQFVMPRADPVAPDQEFEGVSMISREVALARPAVMVGPRTRSGGVPARPLSELATDELLRPDDGEDAFEIGANGALIIRVTERVMTRLDGVHITGGDLGYELAMRRSRGHNTEEPFDHGGSQLHTVTGRGYLIAVPGKHAFSAVSLDDDILYLREDLVFAFQASLRWENGNVPGLRGKLPVVQFRGDGALAMRLLRPLVRVKLPAQGMVFIDADRLAGWIGRVIPRAVVPPAGGPLGAMCVECTGEGIVLVEPAPPAPDDPLTAPRSLARRPRVPGEVEAAMVAPLAPATGPTEPTEIERILALGDDDGDADGGDPAADLLDRLDEL